MAGIEQAPQKAIVEIEKVAQDTAVNTHERTDLEQGYTDLSVTEGKSSQEDAFFVTFSLDDPEDPKNWTKKMEWGVTSALSASGFNCIIVSTMMAPAITTIAANLQMTTTKSTMALSVYLLATVFGPLIIGPLSEAYDRKPLLHVTNIRFIDLEPSKCEFANSKGLLIASRLLAGLGANAVYTLSYGVLGDLWRSEQRGRSLSLYLLFPLTGTAIGPIIDGFIVEHST